MALELNAIGASAGYGQLNRPDALTTAGMTPQTEKVGASATQPLKEAAAEFGALFDKADTEVAALARGEGSAQAVVEAMAQAELALQTAVTIRDRVVEAYQEILRMPV